MQQTALKKSLEGKSEVLCCKSLLFGVIKILSSQYDGSTFVKRASS